MSTINYLHKSTSQSKLIKSSILLNSNTKIQANKNKNSSTKIKKKKSNHS
jgi:hypothetical protein